MATESTAWFILYVRALLSNETGGHGLRHPASGDPERLTCNFALHHKEKFTKRCEFK